MSKSKKLIIREGGVNYRQAIHMHGPDPLGRVALMIYDGPRVATANTTADELRRFIRTALGDPP